MRPVFIGGCPRSGTTMLGAMLGAAPGVVCPPEMEFKVDLLRAGAGGRSLQPAEVRSVVTGDLKATLQGWPPRVPDAIGPATAADVIRGLVREYAGQEPEVWVDHTPANMRLAATLRAAFPDARFVHIVRDGRAVAASLMRLEWGPTSAQGAAHYWLEQLAPGLAAETALEGACVRVRYEDLVLDPEATLRELCAALDIPYAEEMREGGGFSPTKYTREQHARVGRPPDPGAATAWERELTPREIEIFEAGVRDQLELLGYPARYGLEAAAPSTSERRRMQLGDLYRRRVRDAVRRRRRWRAARRAAP